MEDTGFLNNDVALFLRNLTSQSQMYTSLTSHTPYSITDILSQATENGSHSSLQISSNGKRVIFAHLC